MEINVLIEDGIEPDLDSDWLQKIIENTLVAENMPPNIEISLLITGQERIQELNREYRGLDRPTDVLSFSLAEQKGGEAETAFIGPPDGCLHLGEVIISYPQAEMQAQEQRHSIQTELATLTVHGVLHILGYDHEVPGTGPAMLARQAEILASLKKEIK